MTDTTDIPIHRVARARAAAEAIAARVTEANEAFAAAHAALLAEHKVAKAEVEAAEAALRSAALTAHTVTDETKFPGCEVKQYAVLDYAPDAALAWAKESGLALALDKKAFEKIASATDIPCVTKRTEPRVTIKSDLSAFLAPEAS